MPAQHYGMKGRKPDVHRNLELDPRAVKERAFNTSLTPDSPLPPLRQVRQHTKLPPLRIILCGEAQYNVPQAIAGGGRIHTNRAGLLGHPASDSLKLSVVTLFDLRQTTKDSTQPCP